MYIGKVRNYLGRFFVTGVHKLIWNQHKYAQSLS